MAVYMKGLQLTLEEKQLLLESLLFTMSCDVCSDHTLGHRKKMFELAKKINDPDLKLFNIYIYESGISEDEIESKKIIKEFSNLPVHTSIVD